MWVTANESLESEVEQLKAGIVVAKDLRIQALEKTLDETTDAYRKSTDDCTAACNSYKAKLAWFEKRDRELNTEDYTAFRIFAREHPKPSEGT
jgi:hypothetical protein